MNWTMKTFDELTNRELYAILRLRNQVFIVEQVPYQDLDRLDFEALHLFSLDEEGEAVAYIRIFPKGVAFEAASVGRVCVRADKRRQGIAAEMLDLALKHLDEVMKEPLCHISAQRYLVDFYAGRGFVPVGEGYLEDGLPHIGMERKRPEK